MGKTVWGRDRCGLGSGFELVLTPLTVRVMPLIGREAGKLLGSAPDSADHDDSNGRAKRVELIQRERARLLRLRVLRLCVVDVQATLVMVLATVAGPGRGNAVTV